MPTATEQTEVAERAAGLVVGGYRLERPLGRGGMAEVWVGRHEVNGALAAIKLLRSDASANARAMFDNERLALLRLLHPHILPVFDVGEGYIVTAYVEGHDLSHRLRTPIEPHEVRQIVLSVGSALAHAHAREVVHCDVKPSNVLLDTHGTPYLVDFGIAQLSEGKRVAIGRAVGTPAYMAPEQMAGAEALPATDQYALARTIIRMLSGKTPPLSSSTALATLPPKTDPAVIAALERALASAPPERFDCMEDFLAAIRDADLGSAQAKSLRVRPRRDSEPFRWASQPTSVERIGEHTMRADYRLSDLVASGGISEERAEAFRHEVGVSDFGWSTFAREERLGKVASADALARAKEVVVMAHGLFTGRHLWADIAARIARDNGTAVMLTPDVLGCGESPFADDATLDVCTVPHLVTTLRLWLELIGFQDVLTVIMGHSLSATAMMTARATDLPQAVYRIALTPALFRGRFFDRLSLAVNVGLAYTLIAAPRSLETTFARTAFKTERSLRRLRPEVRNAMADAAVVVGPKRVAALLSSISKVTAAPPEELDRCFVVTTPDDPLVSDDLCAHTLKICGIPPERAFRLLYGGHFPHLADEDHPDWASRNMHEIVHLVDNVLDLAREDLASKTGDPRSTEGSGRRPATAATVTSGAFEDEAGRWVEPTDD